MSRQPRVQRELQLEAGGRVVEGLAEEGAEARKAVANGLRMHPELLGDLAHVPLMVEPRSKGLLEPATESRLHVGERRQGPAPEIGHQLAIPVEDERRQVVVRHYDHLSVAERSLQHELERELRSLEAAGR